MQVKHLGKDAGASGRVWNIPEGESRQGLHGRRVSRFMHHLDAAARLTRTAWRRSQASLQSAPTRRVGNIDDLIRQRWYSGILLAFARVDEIENRSLITAMD
jgi:hypothetical protein